MLASKPFTEGRETMANVALVEPGVLFSDHDGFVKHHWRRPESDDMTAEQTSKAQARTLPKCPTVARASLPSSTTNGELSSLYMFCPPPCKS